MTPTLQRFVKYIIVGVSTFLFDLGMLYIAVTLLDTPYQIATPSAFLVAISFNYMFCRQFVFSGTKRTHYRGYLYFVIVAICGAIATTGLVTGLVAYFSIHYLLARTIVAGIIGLTNYFFNLYLNFKVVGKHTTTLSGNSK